MNWSASLYVVWLPARLYWSVKYCVSSLRFLRLCWGRLEHTCVEFHIKSNSLFSVVMFSMMTLISKLPFPPHNLNIYNPQCQEYKIFTQTRQVPGFSSQLGFFIDFQIKIENVVSSGLLKFVETSLQINLQNRRIELSSGIFNILDWNESFCTIIILLIITINMRGGGRNLLQRSC